MKLVGLNWFQETRSFEETPIDIVDNMYLEADVDNGVAITYPDGSHAFVGRILVKLEAKVLDLEKEIKEKYLKHRRYGVRDNMLVILNEPQFNEIAKHFFELGMAVSNKVQKGE